LKYEIIKHVLAMNKPYTSDLQRLHRKVTKKIVYTSIQISTESLIG